MVLRADPPAAIGRDARFLFFVAAVLVALALGFRSELIGPGQVWGLAAGLVVLSVPALFGYLKIEGVVPAVEHFIPVALGATALAGLATFQMSWWQYLVITVVFGIGFVLTGWLDGRRLTAREKPGHLVVQEAALILAMTAALLVVVTVELPLPLRLGWIFAIAMLATYRSFRSLGRMMPPSRAFLFSIFVAQLVMTFAWAMTVYLSYREGPFAAVLVFFWYVNRGIIRHTVEETLSRNVVVEYGLFAVLLAYLFIASYQPHTV